MGKIFLNTIFLGFISNIHLHKCVFYENDTINFKFTIFTLITLRANSTFFKFIIYFFVLFFNKFRFSPLGFNYTSRHCILTVLYGIRKIQRRRKQSDRIERRPIDEL